MKILGLTGIAAGALSVSMAAATPAQAAMYLAQAPLAKSAQTPSLNLDPVRQRASSGSGSRWTPAMQAPGGYAAYRRPFRGYVLPRYWINPRYAISDYRVYNLRAPDNGYRWMRYYDDAVLTDDRGYVYDMEYDLDWNGYETGDIDYDTDGLADGTRVYGGDRYSPPPRQNTRRRISRQGGTYDGEWTGGYVGDDGVYEGTWNGTYVSEDGRTYRGQYRGTYRGDSDYRPAPQDDYGADYDLDPTRDWSENDWEQYCRRDNGVGGAVIGGVVGGVAGNRIADAVIAQLVPLSEPVWARSPGPSSTRRKTNAASIAHRSAQKPIRTGDMITAMTLAMISNNIITPPRQ